MNEAVKGTVHWANPPQLPFKCPSGALQVRFLSNICPFLVLYWLSSSSILILFSFTLSAAAKRRKGKAEANKNRSNQEDKRNKPLDKAADAAVFYSCKMLFLR